MEFRDRSFSVIFIVTLTVFFKAVVAFPAAGNIQEGLEHVGFIDGKDYYKSSILRSSYSWEAGSNFCSSHKLQLASINTVGERQLLKDYFIENADQKTYWLNMEIGPHEQIHNNNLIATSLSLSLRNSEFESDAIQRTPSKIGGDLNEQERACGCVQLVSGLLVISSEDCSVHMEVLCESKEIIV